MKELPYNNANGNWENKILKDLVFIKNHGRYPINKKTLAPTLFIGLAVAFLLRFVLVAFLTRNSEYLTIFIALVFVVSLFIAITSYIRTIRFTSIATKYFANDNQQLIKQFLESEHLAYSRHPEAPEVFQILSRPIGGNDNNREVMVFIADDKRILVNSHYTGQKFNIKSSSKNYLVMARMLRNWINNQNSEKSLISHTD